MTGVLQGELGKTVSTRTIYGFALVCVGFGVLNAVIVGAASGELNSIGEKKEALTSLPVLLLAWGLVGVAGEYRHRTAAPAVLAARRSRSTVLGVRILAYAATGLVLGLLTSAVSLAVALPLLEDMPGEQLTSSDLGEVVAANLVGALLSTMLGAALGALIRNQVAGVVAALILDFAVVPLLSGVDEKWANLTPFGAASVLSGMTHHTTLTVTEAGWVLGAWTMVAVVAAPISEGRRDLA
jgi:ABC-2 type transport system permease protein